MSDKFGIKGNMIVFDPNITDWFEFENKVLKEIRNNKYHTVNAVCEFKQYVGTDIMGSFKLKGDLCTWSNFASQVVAKQAIYRNWLMSCTVTLKAGRKGKIAESAIENGMDMFVTTKAETAIDVYLEHRKLIDELISATDNSDGKSAIDEEFESGFVNNVDANVDI